MIGWIHMFTFMFFYKKDTFIETWNNYMDQWKGWIKQDKKIHTLYKRQVSIFTPPRVFASALDLQFSKKCIFSRNWAYGHHRFGQNHSYIFNWIICIRTENSQSVKMWAQRDSSAARFLCVASHGFDRHRQVLSLGKGCVPSLQIVLTLLPASGFDLSKGGGEADGEGKVPT